jgi:hypothetical protein
MTAGMVNQNAAHRLRGDTEKVCAILPIHTCLIYEFEIGFVHERGRLQGVIRTLLAQVVIRQPPQFVVNERHQTRRRVFIAIAHFLQNLSNVREGHFSNPRPKSGYIDRHSSEV